MAITCKKQRLVRLFQFSFEGPTLKHLDDQDIRLSQAIWTSDASIPLQAGTANCSSLGPQKISSIAESLPHQSNMGLIREDCHPCEDLFKYGSEQAVKEKVSLRPFPST